MAQPVLKGSAAKLAQQLAAEETAAVDAVNRCSREAANVNTLASSGHACTTAAGNLLSSLTSLLQTAAASTHSPEVLRSSAFTQAVQVLSAHLVDAFACIITIQDGHIISQVIAFWESVQAWMLMPSKQMGPHEPEILSQHILGIQSLLSPLLCLMESFFQATGVNPLAASSPRALLVAQVALIFAPAVAAQQCSFAAATLSQSHSEASGGGAEDSSSVAAAASLHRMICAGPLMTLTQEEAALQSHQQYLSSSPHTYDPFRPYELLYSAAHTGAAPESEQAGLPVHCYQLWLHVLQSLPASHSLPQCRASTDQCMRLLASFLAATFQALGGNEQLLASCLLCTLDQLVDTMAGNSSSDPGGSGLQPDWIWDPLGGSQHLMSFFAQLPGLPSLLTALLVSRGGCQDKKKGLEVLELVRIMLGSQRTLGGLTNVCSELLRPETSCGADTRMQALVVMQTAMDDFLSGLRDEEAAAPRDGDVGGGAAAAAADRDARHAACWPQSAAQALFFTAMHDPSIRIRRCALRLLSTLALPHGSPLVTQLVLVLLSKMRDKDTLVQERAVDMLVQLSPVLLLDARITVPEWSWLLRACVARIASGKAPTRFCSSFKSLVTSLPAALNHGLPTSQHVNPTLLLVSASELDAALASDQHSGMAKALKTVSDLICSGFADQRSSDFLCWPSKSK